MPSTTTGCLWPAGRRTECPETGGLRPGSTQRMGGGARGMIGVCSIFPRQARPISPARWGSLVCGEPLPNAEPLHGSDWASWTVPIFQTDVVVCEGAQGTGCWPLLLESSAHLTGKLRAPRGERGPMLWNEPEGYIRTPGPPKQSSHILGFCWPGVHFVPLGEALPDAHWVPFPLNCLRTGSAPALNNPTTILLSTWLKPDHL